jgi:hypothetical protein
MASFRTQVALFPLVIGLGLAVALAGCGGSKSSSLGAQFTASTTATAPGLVKLIQKSKSGARVIVDVVIYGPDAGLDLYAFKFDVKIGDTSIVKFVPQASYMQTALTAGMGQTISVNVDDSAADPSLVKCSIQKTGGGTGNGIGGASAVVIELAFDAKMSGATTLTLVGEGANPPQAFDSTNAPIAGVSFDIASAGVKGVTTGGGGGGY